MKSLVEEFRNFQIIEGGNFGRNLDDGLSGAATGIDGRKLDIDVDIGTPDIKISDIDVDIKQLDIKNPDIDTGKTDIEIDTGKTDIETDTGKTDVETDTDAAKKADDVDTGNPEADTGNPEANKKLKEESDKLKKDIENKNKEIEDLETKKARETDPQKKEEIELEIKKKKEELKILENKNKLHNRALRKLNKYKKLLAGLAVVGILGWFTGAGINMLVTNEADKEKEEEITKIENCIKNYFKNINNNKDNKDNKDNEDNENNEDNEDNEDNEECEKLILQDKQNDFFNKKLNESACPKRPNRPLNVMEIQGVREQYDKDTINYVECLEKILKNNNIPCDYDPEIAKDEIYIGDLTSDPFYKVLTNGQKAWDFLFKDLDKKIIALAILVIGLALIRYGNRIIKFIGLAVVCIGVYLLIDLDNLDKLNRFFEKTKCDLSE